MPTNILSIRPQDAVSPTLGDGAVTDSTGHYQTTLSWQLDATTNLPVGTGHQVTLGR